MILEINGLNDCEYCWYTSMPPSTHSCPSALPSRGFSLKCQRGRHAIKHAAVHVTWSSFVFCVQLPLLEMDGLTMTQSGAVVRYIGSKAGMMGSTPEETLRINEVCEVNV